MSQPSRPRSPMEGRPQRRGLLGASPVGAGNGRREVDRRRCPRARCRSVRPQCPLALPVSPDHGLRRTGRRGDAGGPPGRHQFATLLASAAAAIGERAARRGPGRNRSTYATAVFRECSSPPASISRRSGLTTVRLARLAARLETNETTCRSRLWADGPRRARPGLTNSRPRWRHSPCLRLRFRLTGDRCWRGADEPCAGSWRQRRRTPLTTQ